MEWYSLKPVYIVRGGGSSISEFRMVQSCPAYMEHADLSKTLGAMLMGQLVQGGGGSGDTVQHLGRGLECNATMAIIWSSLAGVEPREK